MPPFAMPRHGFAERGAQGRHRAFYGMVAIGADIDGRKRL